MPMRSTRCSTSSSAASTSWKSGSARRTSGRRREHSMSTIVDGHELTDRLGKVGELASGKSLKRLDKYAKAYIARSPFLCIGTASAEGRADVSPRGDPPGFVRIIDDG